MQQLKRLKLTRLSQEDLAEKQMKALRGGFNCGCGCHYEFEGGGSSRKDNYNSNLSSGKNSYGGNVACGDELNSATHTTHN